MVRDDSNTENESTNNSESEEVEEESETGYSTGTGSSTAESVSSASESVTSTSRRTTTEEGDEEEEEVLQEDTTETSATDDTPQNETIQPAVAASPIQPIKVTSLAKTEDALSKIQLQQDESPPKEDDLQIPQSPHSDKNSLKVQPPPTLHDNIQTVHLISENDIPTIAEANHNANTETKNRSRTWFFPFTRNRDLQDQHERLIPSDVVSSTNLDPGMIHEYTDPEVSSKIMKGESGSNDSSPSRTVSMSDSGTPERVGKISSEKTSSSIATRSHGKNMTILPQHDEGAVLSNDTVALVMDSTAATAVSMRCMFLFLLAALLTVGLSTIGTSYLGADLALRGYKVSSDNTNSNILPSMNDTVVPPVRNDSAVTPPFSMSPCSSGNVPLSFEIVFDSKPAEVGISLRDQTDITEDNSGIWLFPALSFRSFTQFQRKNAFSVCLSNSSTYEFEITDTSGNGLVSTFGASTQVYGNWAIRLDSLVVATYFGDCNDSRRNSSNSECGVYCRCSFNISRSRNSDGGCTSVCT